MRAGSQMRCQVRLERVLSANGNTPRTNNLKTGQSVVDYRMGEWLLDLVPAYHACIAEETTALTPL